MRRSQLEKTLEDYVAGDLEEAARLEVERRIAQEPKTRALHREIRAAYDALQVLRERPAPPVRASEVLPGIQAAIAAQAFQKKPRLYLESEGTRFYRRLALAATLLLGVTFGTFGYVRLTGEPAATPAPVPALRGATAPVVHVERERVSDAEWKLIEAGSREGITAEEYFRLLKELQRNPRGVLPVISPVDIYNPGSAEER